VATVASSPLRRDLDDLVQLLEHTADRAAAEISAISDWALSGQRDGQYRADVRLDDLVVTTLVDGGVGVLSEETGVHHSNRSITVVVAPLDGSTNASRGLIWSATALCAFDDAGPLVALIHQHPDGRRWRARRGAGATRDHTPIRPSSCQRLGDALIGVSGYPRRHLGWNQFRAWGAAALDICLVAQGSLDGFMDVSVDAHGIWDYAAGALVCQEAGAPIMDVHSRDLFALDPTMRRTPVAAGTEELLTEMVSARRGAS
jgi:myo-inositol-1(or 4)-monophosphatase